MIKKAMMRKVDAVAAGWMFFKPKLWLRAAYGTTMQIRDARFRPVITTRKKRTFQALLLLVEHRL